MTHGYEIKLKVATIFDETVGEKKKPRRQRWISTGSACAVTMMPSFTFALYLNNSWPEPPPNTLQGKINSPPPGSVTDRALKISGYTKDIPFERPYRRLTVDVKEIGLCPAEINSALSDERELV